MVRHDDPHDMRGRRPQARGRLLHLFFIQSAAAAKNDRPGAVQPDYDHFFINEHRPEIVRDVAAITSERPQEPGHDIVEGPIVIARNDDLGKWKLLKKGAGLNELAPAGPLSQIT